MFEFWKGWRRKAGCVLLVFALAGMGAWIRSRAVWDQIRLQNRGPLHLVGSNQGAVHWVRFDEITSDAFSWDWESAAYEDLNDADTSERVELVPTWGWKWGGFDIDSNGWTIPYWSFVIPLTILSAYLLLWPSRRIKPPSPN